MKILNNKKIKIKLCIPVLTFNGETDAFTDGGWNSVGSDAQISGHVVTANFIQVQMSPLPFRHYIQTAHTAT